MINKIFQLRFKLILFTVLSITITLLCTGIALDFVLKDLYSRKAWNDSGKSFENLYLQVSNIEKALYEHAILISQDSLNIASINLINSYQNKADYQPLIFDEEKKKVAEKLLQDIIPEQATYFAVYDIKGDLSAYAYNDKGVFKSGIVSYSGGQAEYLEKVHNKLVWKKVHLAGFINKKISKLANLSSFVSYAGKTQHISNVDNLTILASKVMSRIYPDGKKTAIGVVETAMHLDSKFFHEKSTQLQSRFTVRLGNGRLLNPIDNISPIKNIQNLSGIFGSQQLNEEIQWLANNLYFTRAKVWLTADKNTYLLSLTPKQELLSALNETRLTLLIIYLLTALIILPFGIYWLNRRVSNPLHQLTENAKSIEEGNYNSFNVYQSRDEIGSLGRIFNQMVDTIRLRETTLQKSEKRLTHSQKISRLGNWEFDFQSALWTVSEQAKQILCIDSVEHFNVEVFFYNIMEDDLAAVKQTFYRALELKTPINKKYQIICANGQLKTIHCIAEIVQDKNNTFHLTGTSQDISELQIIQDKLEHLAHHDPLTGLANRVLFNDRLTQAIYRHKRMDKKLLVMFLDLDHFKDINDTMGHYFGDRLLKIVADKLKNTLREEDSIARIGGDEFNIIVEQLDDIQDASLIAGNLLAIFSEPFSIDEHKISIHMSIGISVYPEHGSSVVELIKNADTAMYKAKALGRNMYQFYAREMTTQLSERMNLLEMLRKAIANEEFSLNYQPQISLQQGNTIGAEVLIRWRHQTQGFISPGQFIPLAEQSGLIIPIGEWVLSSALKQYKNWLQQGVILSHISVNLSSVQLNQIDVPEMVNRLLTLYNLPANCLELEITESYIMENQEQAIQTLKILKEQGVRFALDDFGTGYSSMSYLRIMPINTLKIDKSFVDDLPENNSAGAITRTIISLARNLELDVIAEGVETQAQFDYLKANGCDQIQGYFTGRPMSANDFFAFVKNSKH